MKMNEILSWLLENPTEADKLRNLLVTKEEHLRKVAELLAKDGDYIKSISDGLTERQLVLLKHRVELLIFDRHVERLKHGRQYG